MLTQTIISLVVIATLTLIMSFLLIKIVNKMNKRSKEYFEKKIVVYDELIDERQKHLDSLEQKIDDKATVESGIVDDEKEHGSGLIVANEKIPEYKIEDFFEQAKVVDDKFKFDKEGAIKKFINERIDRSDKNRVYEKLKIVYDRLCNTDRYELMVKNFGTGWDYVNDLMDEELRKIMRPYVVGSPRANMNEVLGYIKLEMDKADLGIVVETGNKEDNFSHISDKIKTVYNPDIYRGIRIFYQDRMYDYSLGGVM